MKIELKRTLEEDRLTQQRIFDMRCDETIIARCDDAASWKTAERVAYLARQNADRKDGFVYEVNSSAVDMAVTISLVKKDAP